MYRPQTDSPKDLCDGFLWTGSPSAHLFPYKQNTRTGLQDKPLSSSTNHKTKKFLARSAAPLKIAFQVLTLNSPTKTLVWKYGPNRTWVIPQLCMTNHSSTYALCWFSCSCNNPETWRKVKSGCNVYDWKSRVVKVKDELEGTDIFQNSCKKGYWNDLGKDGWIILQLIVTKSDWWHQA